MAQPNPLALFLSEADELLSSVEEIVLDLQGQSQDPEAINRLFRAFHTIKGSSAMCGLDAVADFTHHLETALDKVRSGSLALSRELLELVLAARDQIQAIIDSAQNGQPAPTDNGDRLIATLNSLCGGASENSTNSPTSAMGTVASLAEQGSKIKTWKINFRPDPLMMATGTNPGLLLRELRELGECEVSADISSIPDLETIEPDHCYLKWDIALRTDKSENDIKDVFIFVEDGSEIGIELLQQSSAPVVPCDGANSAADPKQVAEPSIAKKETTISKVMSKETSVRVPSEKLDVLVNLVGELVMNQSRLKQVSARLDVQELAFPVEEIERLVSELRDNVLGIRMMPIGATFNRFRRLVHDLSAELGKDVEFVTEGAETELDKTVLDQLGEPLVHLVRNSIDHGLETAEQRLNNGKPARGTIRLSAVHTGSNVVVSIQDDGRGIDPVVVLEKAVERKLVSPEAVLSEREIFNLIFLPGFSTAKEVTKVSGRGVGMDVVKRQIEALRGAVAIESSKGAGTTILLTLPLTLAIIDGLLVEVAGDQFIIPMSLVTENVELRRDERARNNGRNVVSVRGELVPYVRLRDSFDVEGTDPDLEKIVIVRHEGQFVGLVVDRVLGSHQTVIQSLGKFYSNVVVFSGATIMGDGRVALILDVPGLVHHVDRLCRNQIGHQTAALQQQVLAKG